jgi:hypothetical protein
VTTMHEQHLLLADQHIVDAEARVARQRVLIDELVVAATTPPWLRRC